MEYPIQAAAEKAKSNTFTHQSTSLAVGRLRRLPVVVHCCPCQSSQIPMKEKSETRSDKKSLRAGRTKTEGVSVCLRRTIFVLNFVNTREDCESFLSTLRPLAPRPLRRVPRGTIREYTPQDVRRGRPRSSSTFTPGSWLRYLLSAY